MIPILLLSVRAATGQEILLGRVRQKDILSISAEWRANRDAYEPADTDVRRIAAIQIPATLEVYFGSWCSDSRREVPRLLKIMDRASPSRMKVRFYGVDRSKKEPARLVRKGSVERVPTFILMLDGREIGRIVETPETSLEHDLAVLVEQVASPPP